MRVVGWYLILVTAVLVLAAMMVIGQTPQVPAAATGPSPASGRASITNQTDASWHHSPNEKPGVENLALHEDPATGALAVFGRYPAGYVFPPHWHTANERLVLLEGRMQIDLSGKQKNLEQGGFAFLPAREIQKMSCVSKSRCVLYMSWDSAFDIHRAP